MTLRTEAGTQVEGTAPEETAGIGFLLGEQIDRLQPEDEGPPLDRTEGERASLGGVLAEGADHLPCLRGLSSQVGQAKQGRPLEELSLCVRIAGERRVGAHFLVKDHLHQSALNGSGERSGGLSQVEGSLDRKTGLFGACQPFNSPLCGTLGIHLGQHTLKLGGDHVCSKREEPAGHRRALRGDGSSKGARSPELESHARSLHQNPLHSNGSSMLTKSSYFVDNENGVRYDWAEVTRAVRAAPRKEILIERTSGLVGAGDDEPMATMTATIPQNNDELVKYWGLFVASELRRLGRVKFNAEDMLQSVFLSLIARGVVEKFWAGVAERSHPLTVNGTDAARMLGISWEGFQAHQEKSEGTDEGLAPVDAEGHRVDGNVAATGTRYLFAEVIVLAGSVNFPDQGELWLPEPRKPTVGQWRTYLAVAIRNASANVTRTWARRCSREHAPDHFTQFRDSDGVMRFEELLPDVSAEASMEQGLSVALLRKRAPGLETRRTAEGMNFFDLLREGYTIREATKAIGLTRYEQRVLAKHVEGLVLLYPGLG